MTTPTHRTTPHRVPGADRATILAVGATSCALSYNALGSDK
ncbi:hypothetical protein [Streptomyces sp. NPDC102462]